MLLADTTYKMFVPSEERGSKLLSSEPVDIWETCYLYANETAAHYTPDSTVIKENKPRESAAGPEESEEMFGAAADNRRELCEDEAAADSRVQMLEVCAVQSIMGQEPR